MEDNPKMVEIKANGLYGFLFEKIGNQNYVFEFDIHGCSSLSKLVPLKLFI